MPLIDDDVEGSSYSKLLEDDEDEAVDVGEVSGSSDFARDDLVVVVVGDSSRTKEETDSVPSANLFIRFRPVVVLIIEKKHLQSQSTNKLVSFVI